MHEKSDAKGDYGGKRGRWGWLAWKFMCYMSDGDSETRCDYDLWGRMWKCFSFGLFHAVG